jgi:hypothetical protein
MRNILDNAKIFPDLWIFFIGNCGREKFQGVLFRNNLEALGVVSTSHKMIRE